MTKKAQEAQKAYLRGFCKVANAYGVDPAALLKYAQSPALLAARTAASNLFGRASGAGKRFWELLGGGSKELKTTNELLKQHKAYWLDLLKKPRYTGELGKLQWEKDYAEALKQFMNHNYTPKLQNEALKVLGARVGAGAAGVAGASMLLGDNNKHSYPYRYYYG